MKKRFVTILAILASASALWADPIDLARAKRIATAYMSEGTVPEIVSSPVQTRSTTMGKSPLYIFDRGNDQGFVIISGDDCMPEVLGYTEKGNFNPEELPPALLDWIEGYSTMISKAQEANATSLATTPLAAATAKQDVAPLVTAHWSQGSPYNDLCPYRNDGGGRAVTGCVATAASQVVYYWRKELPRKTLYDTPTYGYGDAPVTESIPTGTPLKYELMQDYYSSSTPADMNEAVATLMSVVGTSTWLTYGSSTSGQISNLVNTFQGQFRLSSTCTYKSGYTQSAWEDLIYEDLEKGWPIVYSGVSPTQGGHAVVIDGYRAADNLFHFNFGWGGSGDGYFTVNDTNGMNGFNEQQGMTHKIHPNATLLSGKIKANELCARLSNTIAVEITNNGTAGCSGLYIYSSKTEGAPSSISSANIKDLTTVIASGETKTVFLKYNPASVGTYYMYLMDEYARILDQTTVNTIEQKPMLTFEDLIVRNGISARKDITVDGRAETVTYHKIYGDQAEVVAQISNAEEATLTIPLIIGTLYAYNEEQGAWESQKSLSTITQQFPKGETTDLTFRLTGLDSDRLYAASVSPTYRVSSVYHTMDMNANDTVVYFTLQESDLAITEVAGGGAVLAGHWNTEKFKELTQNEAFAYYDLTATEGVDICPETANPNALFYVNENATASGRNIIKNGVCEQLHLVYGNDFKPKEDFTAKQAAFELDNTPLQWSYIALPFDCKVPDGSMARKITKLTNSLMSGADAVNETMEKGIPYLYKGTRTGSDLLTAENVEVCAVPKEFSDTLKVTFTSFYGVEGMRKLNANTIQKFTTAKNARIPAFCGYITYDIDAEADAFIHATQDAASKALAAVLNEAFAAEEKYEGKVSEEVWNTFVETLGDAAACYTQQTSVEEMKSMTADLTEILNKVVVSEIFTGEPIDLTASYMENPSFELKRTTGWTLTRVTGQTSKVMSVTTLDEYMVGADGDYVFYSYSTTGKGSATLSQTLTGLPEGYYRIAAGISTEEGASVTMFANDKTATMTDEGFGMRYLTETVIDGIKVTDGTLEFGINGTEQAYKADNFRLYYMGGLETSVEDIRTGADSFKAWGGEGLVNLLVPEGAPVDVSIYTTDGRLCRRLTAEGFRQVTNLPRGIYIVNRQKVVVR